MTPLRESQRINGHAHGPTPGPAADVRMKAPLGTPLCRTGVATPASTLKWRTQGGHSRRPSPLKVTPLKATPLSAAARRSPRQAARSRSSPGAF